MPLYEVLSLDVWGNAADGYEVNNSSREGTVMLPTEANDEQVVQRLIDRGLLGRQALTALRDSELGIDGDFDTITITEQDAAWVAVLDGDVDVPHGDYPRYLDATNQHQAENAVDPETERAEEVEGDRPILQLVQIDGRSDAVPFFRKQLEVGTKMRGQPDPRPAILELRIDTKKPTSGNKSRTDFEVDSYVDGEFFGTFLLGEMEDETIGVSKHGHDIEADADLISEARVAMDAFLEAGQQPTKQFVPDRESLLPAEAKRLLEQIRENVKAMSQKKVSQDEFYKTSRELWDRARALGYDSELAQLVTPTISRRIPEYVRRLRVGDHVRFKTPAHHNISNFDIDISGMTGTVTQADRDNIWIEIHSMRYVEELREWDNALQFMLSEGDFPQLEIVEEELANRGLPFKPCGLNADWSMQAWMLSDGAPNRTNGAYYLLDSEDDRGNYAIVRRFYEDEPGYVEEDDGVEEVISDGPLTQVLNEYMGIMDR